jgi:hypothetical protein
VVISLVEGLTVPHVGSVLIGMPNRLTVVRKDYTTSPGYIQPAWVARLTENKLGGSPPKVPVFQYHGTGDQLVQFAQADALHKAYCAAGVQETWKTYDTDHITLVYTGNADVLAFVKDRIAGKPAASNC